MSLKELDHGDRNQLMVPMELRYRRDLEGTLRKQIHSLLKTTKFLKFGQQKW